MSEWCVVANVKPEARGRATAAGTRHFAAGAKIWCLPPAWGDGYEHIRVIGRHRGSHRHISIIMASRYLTNWRAKVAYHPEVIRLLHEHGSWGSQEACERMAGSFGEVSPDPVELRREAARLNKLLHLLSSEPRGRDLESLAAAALAATEHLSPRPSLPELDVVSDWLEERGFAVPREELVKILERRRRNR
jgi:hypothetical protein